MSKVLVPDGHAAGSREDKIVDGLTDVMVITAAVALVASVVGVFLIRPNDLHESAL
ncbi:hypothetical protein [Micromonospora sp. ALFpr18c]|uniref:hypothetical protein n=1 Tax=unclassified Micromonospora TaxID=2617518 RepID=UPI001788B969|nr:hypothetical protein [Micromonospora sp. ALFpr18c]